MILVLAERTSRATRRLVTWGCVGSRPADPSLPPFKVAVTQAEKEGSWKRSSGIETSQLQRKDGAAALKAGGCRVRAAATRHRYEHTYLTMLAETTRTRTRRQGPPCPLTMHRLPHDRCHSYACLAINYLYSFVDPPRVRAAVVTACCDASNNTTRYQWRHPASGQRTPVSRWEQPVESVAYLRQGSL